FRCASPKEDKEAGGQKTRRRVPHLAMRRAPWLRSLLRHARKPGPPGSPGAGALAFRRPTAVSDKAFDLAGLGLIQRFLESPDANGRTLSGTSAASTSQTG